MGRLGAITFVAVWLAVCSVASAAFPGRNGLLAVQPLDGRGIVLVGADGRGQHRICTARPICGRPVRPRFSPDGRSILLAGPAVRLIGTDGNCQNCRFGVAPNPAFLPGGAVITFVSGGALVADGIDGLRLATLVQSATDAVWSGSGKLAVISGARVWVGTPGKLRSLGKGSSPSWSPNGTRLAFARRGWITVVPASGGRARRPARGSSPAFSPDGRSVAFIGPSRRLRVIGSFGGRARTVGTVRGLAVDWQPLPAHPAACVAPPGAKVIAQSSSAVVTREARPDPGDGISLAPTAAMGCLFADGRERLLEQSGFNSIDGAIDFSEATLGGTYAAVMVHDFDSHYDPVDSQTIDVFDLRTGARSGLGGESADCSEFRWPCSRIQQILVSPRGVSAVHADRGATQPVGSLNVRCASPSFCVTYDQYGQVSVSTDPTVSSSWSSAQVGLLKAMSCPSASLCVGVEQSGHGMYVSTNPASGSPTWTKVPAPANTVLADVDCPSTMLCVAIGGTISAPDGLIYVSTNPAGGSGAWSAEPIAGAGSLLGISCPTASQCFATDNKTDLVSSTDPTGGAGAWTVRQVSPFALQHISCASSSLCVASAYGPSSPSVLVSTDPANGSWTLSSNLTVDSVSCPPASLCVTFGDGDVAVSTDPGSGSWAGYRIFGAGGGNVSCPSASFCMLGGTNDGNVYISTNPADGTGTWTPVLADRINCASTPDACGTEQIIASDRAGVHTLGSSTEFEAQTGPQLTGLSITGNTLSRSDHGSPKSAQLTP
ncbi:hypothetical protein AYO39_00330 [Actinobacteria bacterium SCGC AG-212-D09]|nr:hypothetical protein AYO39_00330 [Actinobacteria bacterium SCGC AG-212-D09]